MDRKKAKGKRIKAENEIVTDRGADDTVYGSFKQTFMNTPDELNKTH